MKCVKGFEIKVLNSSAGYYIGTLYEEDGWIEPNCRCSNYFECSKEEVQDMIDNMSFNVRICSENQWCSGGACFESFEEKVNIPKCHGDCKWCKYGYIDNEYKELCCGYNEEEEEF